MPKFHKVEQGDCLASIAAKYGFTDLHTIYDHPKNATLKGNRPHPNVLAPEDIVYIPDKQEKQEARGTAKQHHFQLPNTRLPLRIVLRDPEGQPYANKRYQLKLEECVLHGASDGSGVIEQKIPIDATEADLTVWVAEDVGRCQKLHRTLKISYLDPVKEISGIQARLNNLGYECGTVDGIIGPMTKSALEKFQEQNGLAISGEVDAATQSKLLDCHGC